MPLPWDLCGGKLEQLSCSGSLPPMTFGRHTQVHGEEEMAMIEIETAPSTELEINLDSIPRDLVALIRHALHGLQFGDVTLVVHDGHVVQLDRIEHSRHKRTTRSR